MESSSLRGKIQIASIYINSRFSLSWCVSVIQLFFATFDFKSGEHHMDSWGSFFCGGRGGGAGHSVSRRCFVIQVLPFALSTACYVFTKVLHPLVKR